MRNLKIISSQYPSPFEDDLIQHWREDIKRIYTDWIFLYTDYAFFKNVAQGIAKSHDLKKSPPFDFYHMALRYYLNSLCLAVRKSVDRDEKSVSLLVILSSMYIHNDLFTLERGYESVSQKDSEFWKNQYKKTWDEFTDSDNSNFISKKVISSKIDKLFEVTKPIKDFTNANIAHHSRKTPSKQQQTKYKDLWDAANYIIDLLANLNSLLNFSIQLLEATPQHDRYSHLYEPWLNKTVKIKRAKEEKFSHINWV